MMNIFFDIYRGLHERNALTPVLVFDDTTIVLLKLLLVWQKLYWHDHSSHYVSHTCDNSESVITSNQAEIRNQSLRRTTNNF